MGYLWIVDGLKGGLFDCSWLFWLFDFVWCCLEIWFGYFGFLLVDLLICLDEFGLFAMFDVCCFNWFVDLVDVVVWVVCLFLGVCLVWSLCGFAFCVF